MYVCMYVCILERERPMQSQTLRRWTAEDVEKALAKARAALAGAPMLGPIEQLERLGLGVRFWSFGM